MHRVFVDHNQIPTITGSDAHYIKNVLRLKAGDQLELLDGSGKVYLVKISTLNKEQINCETISTSIPQTETKTKITIAQAIPKAKKMDLIIQKCTELGVAKIIPTLTERCIAKGEKIKRWQKIAKEGAEQCGRTTIPEISPVIKFEEVIKLKDQYDLSLLPWELEENTSLKKVLSSNKPKEILILIGPEGGFSQEEVKLAKSAGFTTITLGPRILRTETAGLVILAMINYEYEQA